MEKSRVEIAVARFEEGFSCSQAILSAFRGSLPDEAALKVASAFGGGVAGTGDFCGAVSGALMAIGMAYGRTRADDLAAKDKTYALSIELMEKFRKKNGSAICRDLLGHDMGTPEGKKMIKELGLHDKACAGYVRDAAELLESILQKNK